MRTPFLRTRCKQPPKPKRKQHRLRYYTGVLRENPDLSPAQLEALLMDAACQMPSVLTDTDYNLLYWLVQSRK